MKDNNTNIEYVKPVKKAVTINIKCDTTLMLSNNDLEPVQHKATIILNEAKNCEVCKMEFNSYNEARFNKLLCEVTDFIKHIAKNL